MTGSVKNRVSVPAARRLAWPKFVRSCRLFLWRRESGGAARRRVLCLPATDRVGLARFHEAGTQQKFCAEVLENEKLARGCRIQRKVSKCCRGRLRTDAISLSR